MLDPPSSERKGLGSPYRASGHNRVPPPPARITATTAGRELIEEPVPDDAPDRTDAVLPGDLLPRCIIPPVIGHGNFINSAAESRDLEGELGLEPEAIRAEPQALEEVRPEDLVARLHVRKVEIREHVGKCRQEPVPDIVPEEKHPMRLSPESRPIHDVRFVLEDRFEQAWVFERVVFEVGVLHQDDVSRDSRKSGSQSRPLAAVLIVIQDHELRRAQAPENITGPVARSVVDDDDLLRDRDGADSFEDLPDGADLVVDGDDDRKPHARKASTVRRRPSSMPIFGS